MKRYAILTVGILLMATGAFAQATQSATANATIIEAMSIEWVAHLNFGIIAAGATGSSNVTVAADGTASISQDNNAVLLGGTVNAAQFLVRGATGYGYTIGIDDDTITIDDAGTGMPMALTLTLDSTTGTADLTTGTTHYVGGTLAVPAGQVAGDYSGTFSVTANYN